MEIKRARITHHASRFMPICALLFAIALAGGSALADVAPPEQPPGSNISPGSPGQTQVVMSAERVVIEVQPSADTATAKVTGDFVMRNTGATAEAMMVRFPLGNPSGQGSGSTEFPIVENFVVQVGGNILPTTVITTSNLRGSEIEPVKWAAFDVTFPPGQDTPIGVTYNIRATGSPPSARFAYVLETGAGWKDAIRSADIVLRLPYAATNDNIFYSASTPGWQFVGNEIRWRWNNLEPTSKDNLSVTILAPKAWQAILDARAAVDAKPVDASALVTLAKAYHNAITTKFPSYDHDLYATKSEETYQRALALDPNSAGIHAAYARAIWDHMSVPVAIPADDPNLRRVLAEISMALEIDPQNAEAKALYEEIPASVEGTVVLPTPINSASPSPTTIVTTVPTVLEASPTTVPMPTAEATVIVAPTAITLPPVGTAAPKPTPSPTAVGSTASSGGDSTLPLTIGIVALPVIAALATLLIVTRRREEAGKM